MHDDSKAADAFFLFFGATVVADAIETMFWRNTLHCRAVGPKDGVEHSDEAHT